MTDAPYESTPPVFAYDAASGLVGRAPRRVGGSIVASTVVALSVAVLGAGIGWIWSELAPRIAVVKADQGFYYADSEPEQAIAGDGWFVILGLAAGVLFAVLAWYLLRRYRGPVVLVGLTVGSIVGALVAWWVGYKIGMAQFDAIRGTAAVGARVSAPLGLRISGYDEHNFWSSVPSGVGVVQALAAAAVYTLFSGFSGYQDLRGDPLPGYQPMPYYQPLTFDQQALSLDPANQPRSENQTETYGQAPPSDQARPYGQPPADQPQPYGQAPPSVESQPSVGENRPDQLGPGLTGNSDSATGTART